MARYIDKDKLIRNADFKKFYEKKLGKIPKVSRNGLSEVDCKCKFHNDKKPGSFAVDLKTGDYHCFSCGAHGSVVNFIMHEKNITYYESLEELEREVYYG
tara:strand:+ start:594 stop:893 length:300 start_codon:yes stop_codon:yes gene_type:complete